MGWGSDRVHDGLVVESGLFIRLMKVSHCHGPKD